MGFDKAAADLNGESLLHRTCRLVSQHARRTIVVAAPDQVLPHDLTPAITVLRDKLPHQGPLYGFVTGLQFLTGEANFPDDACCWLSACDVPFAEASVILHLTDLCRNAPHTGRQRFDAVVMMDSTARAHPLGAVYQVGVRSMAESLIASGERSMNALLSRLNVLRIPAETLSTETPHDRLLWNLNTPTDLQTARRYLSEN